MIGENLKLIKQFLILIKLIGSKFYAVRNDVLMLFVNESISIKK